MKRQQQQQQKQQREREAAESEERIAEHHHPTLPQEYYATQLPLQNHTTDFPPVAERTMSFGNRYSLCISGYR